jgi:hypothetical protein
VRDLNLSKKQTELFGFKLQGWNFIHQDTEICFFRSRLTEFTEFSSQPNDLVFCNEVCLFIESLEHQHDPTEWRLCIFSSKATLKAVLLRNGDKFPSVPLAHDCNMKESLENMNLPLEKIQYKKYN